MEFTEHVADLGISLTMEDELRQTFGPRMLLAYHCTRLLTHEADAIRTTGLRLLDRQLVEDRIAAAARAGELSDEQRRRAETGNIFAVNNESGRMKQICLVIGRSAFDEDSRGCDALLRYWGGEAIRGGPEEVQEFASLGAPSIVVATVDLTRPHNEPYSWPALANLFVGRLLGLDKRHAEVHYREPIPGEHIVSIWQPGDAEYDRHTDLPR